MGPFLPCWLLGSSSVRETPGVADSEKGTHRFHCKIRRMDEVASTGRALGEERPNRAKTCMLPRYTGLVLTELGRRETRAHASCASSRCRRGRMGFTKDPDRSAPRREIVTGAIHTPNGMIDARAPRRPASGQRRPPRNTTDPNGPIPREISRELCLERFAPWKRQPPAAAILLVPFRAQIRMPHDNRFGRLASRLQARPDPPRPRQKDREMRQLHRSSLGHKGTSGTQTDAISALTTRPPS